MSHFEIYLAVLMVAIPLVALARRANIAYPIVLVVAGLFLGFLPALPSQTIPPDLILVIYLPPVLYWEAVNAPTRAFRTFATPITRLVIGLVFVTTACVAVVLHAFLPAIPWAAAIAFGAIVAPTDEAAFTPVAERFGVPRRVVAIVQGEALLNDAVSLILYSAAIGVVAGEGFSLAHSALQLVWSCVAAIAIGLAVGWLVVAAYRLVKEPDLAVLVSFFGGYLAYIPALHAGVSGVLAAVVAGLYAGRYAPPHTTPKTRVLAASSWTVILFVLNATVFIAVGLQLHPILASLQSAGWRQYLIIALAINAVIIVVRFFWNLAISYPIDRYLRNFERIPPWRYYLLTSWAGFRGGVSLAAALAIPVMLPNHQPFPYRGPLIFLTFTVILVTLVGQGGLLPQVLRLLHIKGSEDEELREERIANGAARKAALKTIEKLAKRGLDPKVAGALRARFSVDAPNGPASLPMRMDGPAYNTALAKVLAAQHAAFIALRDSGQIENTTMRHVDGALDLQRLQVDELLRHRTTDEESLV